MVMQVSGFSQLGSQSPSRGRQLASLLAIVHSDARLLLLSRIDGDAPRAQKS